MTTKEHGFEPHQTRYFFDSKLKGFAQLDTAEDASYYGNWANASTLELFSFAEGDTCYTKCDTVEEFRAEMLSFVEFCERQGKDYFRGIDPGARYTPELLKPWRDAGLIQFIGGAE